MRREVNRVLAGAAADFQHITRAVAEKRFEHRRDRGVVAMKRGRIEPSIFRRRGLFAELNNKLSHCFTLSLRRPQTYATTPSQPPS